MDINDLDEALGMLGVRMFKRRKELGLSLDQVAKISGLAKTHVWDIEQGKSRNPTIRTVWKIGRALRWTMDEFLGFADDQSCLMSQDAIKIALQIDEAIQRALDSCHEPDQKRNRHPERLPL